jgi:nuclear mRNA export protein SAC3
MNWKGGQITPRLRPRLTHVSPRKFRVLDDCARLRDIIEKLPAKRYFVPSLLVFDWEGSKGPGENAEFVNMVSK